MTTIIEVVERGAQKALMARGQEFTVEKILTADRYLKINLPKDATSVERAIKFNLCGQENYKLVPEVYAWHDNMQTYERREAVRILPDIWIEDFDRAALTDEIAGCMGTAIDIAWSLGEEDLNLVSKLHFDED